MQPGHTRRAQRSSFNKQDIFGSDLIAKTPSRTMYVQVTTGSGNVSARRRKLEAVPWCSTDEVYIFEYRETLVGRKKMYHFRIHQMVHTLDMMLTGVMLKWEIKNENVPIQPGWFRVNGWVKQTPQVLGAAP